MDKRNPLYQEVVQAHKTAQKKEDFQPAFIEEIKIIVKRRLSPPFYFPEEIEHDIGYISNTANENELMDRQLIYMVADYIRRAQEIDAYSRQNNGTNDIYMKRIK